VIDLVHVTPIAKSRISIEAEIGLPSRILPNAASAPNARKRRLHVGTLRGVMQHGLERHVRDQFGKFQLGVAANSDMHVWKFVSAVEAAEKIR
jgi:hypothetical protein